MKQGRTPDRVHVVRPPENDFRAEGQVTPPSPQARGMEIVRTLALISDKLKRSEAERYELLAELREYRKALNELEDKADKSEKAYLTLENKIKNRDALESELSQRQARFERALKETESKLVQASAGQALLDKRVKDTEEFQTGVAQRMDEFITQQTRLDRQIDKIGQDKSRMLRKVERMEEIVSETQDALKARALVLLTDQSAAVQAGYPLAALPGPSSSSQNDDAPWWRRSVRMQTVGMASMIVAALLFGWTINQIQQPEIPKIAVLENGGIARLNLQENRWEPINGPAAQSSSTATPPAIQEEPSPISQTQPEATPVADSAPVPLAPVPTEQTPAAENILNSSDDELMAALEADPDKLAAQLNELSPGVSNALEDTAPAPRSPQAAPALSNGGYNPLVAFESKAFSQDPELSNEIAKEKGTAGLSDRIAPDATLPAAIKQLESQAFAGVPEAQHDLAAIYTAGNSQVTQNFEKAALWFREAADNKVANASYNLGVLYHQGLGVEKDLDRALYWYREAAKLGHPEAQYNLGISYIEGIGSEYDAALAAAFFESAANQGVAEAAYNLGLIYENGLLGKAAKTEDALLWYKIAADHGNAEAKAALQQLASALKIDSKDIGSITDRMQATYQSTHGRRAGLDKRA